MRIIISAILATLITSSVAANDGYNMLSAMPESKRAAIFSNLIQSSANASCRPTKVSFQGFDHDNAAYWTTSCDNRKAFLIQVANDKTATSRVTDCAVLKLVNVDCFKKLK